MADDIEYINQAQIDNIREVFDLQYLTDEDLETLIETYDLVELNAVDLSPLRTVINRLPSAVVSRIDQEIPAQHFNLYENPLSNGNCFVAALLLAAMPYLKAVRVSKGPGWYLWFVADDNQLEHFNNNPQKDAWLDKFECHREYAIL